MPADVLFLIALVAHALAHIASWRAAKLSAAFGIHSDAKVAGYALLSIFGSATVLAILALYLPLGTL